MSFKDPFKQRRAEEQSLLGTKPERPPGAPTPLHVLLLEDSAADADLIVHELRRSLL